MKPNTFKPRGPDHAGCYLPPGALNNIKLAAAQTGETPGEWMRRGLLAELARAGHPVHARMPARDAPD